MNGRFSFWTQRGLALLSESFMPESSSLGNSFWKGASVLVRVSLRAHSTPRVDMRRG
ncbi:hypothetical protein RRG08_011980 [Elysia crispata]|uniref:Uncharacterized protein n=1 Tax=Elysia crispata TaxID=231223 RepID=A0AAE0ZHB7_9GAST|nr:hypothetical protein RRG08_011980 [Elysia crispata]